MKRKSFSFPFAVMFALILAVMISPIASADTVTAKGPPTRSTTGIQLTEAGLGFAFINDGHNGLASFNYHLLAIAPRFALNAMTAVDPASSTSTKLYEGVFGTYKVYDKGGLAVSIGAGWKGIDTSDWTFQKNNAFVWGLQLTVPIK